MKRLIAVLATIAPSALATDVPLFKVDIGVDINYGDGTKVSITTDRVIELEGFTCSVERVSRSLSNPFFFGPSFYCQLPGSDAAVSIAARCDARVPGSVSDSSLNLKGSSSPEFKVLTQVVVSCETSYTRAVAPVKTKTEKM